MIKCLNKEHCYYIDKNNKEWCFTEINGGKNFFYFKCSTHKCNGFGKILRNGENKEFSLTKKHTLSYEEHIYYKNIITPNNIKRFYSK